MIRTVLYRADKLLKKDGSLTDSANTDFRSIFWRPSLLQVVPPGKGKKYFFYWLFHYLRIFRNRDYSAVLVYDGYTLASSLLVIPTYYKWPFMAANDVQLIYVLTRPEYRGKGLAERAVRLAILDTQKEERTIWYVTNSENFASKGLCEKIGFTFAGFGKKIGYYLKLAD